MDKKIKKTKTDVTLNEVLTCFEELKKDGFMDLKFQIFQDESGSIISRERTRVIAFNNLKDLERIFRNMGF